MKKVLSIMMVMIILGISISAYAAPASKQNKDIGGGMSDNPDIKIEKIADTEGTRKIKNEVIKRKNSDDVLSYLPDSVKAKIPGDRKVINEMETVRLAGNMDGLDSLRLTYKFETPYEQGTLVSLVIALPTDNSNIEWFVFEGVANKEKNVEFTIDKEFIQKAKNDPFVIIAISKK